MITSFPTAGVVLVFHSILSSTYGLRILLENASRYPFLMRTRFRQFCSILMHVIGMGGFAFHLDYLVDLLQTFKARMDRSLSRDDFENNREVSIRLDVQVGSIDPFKPYVQDPGEISITKKLQGGFNNDSNRPISKFCGGQDAGGSNTVLPRAGWQDQDVIVKIQRDAKNEANNNNERRKTSILSPVHDNGSIQNFDKSPLGVWKQQHLNAMQLIQAFVESLPQFLLQTAAAFLDWTNGTSKQCFPGERKARWLNR